MNNYKNVKNQLYFKNYGSNICGDIKMIVTKNDINDCFKYNFKIAPKDKKLNEKLNADGWICNQCSCSTCACSCVCSCK